MISRKSSCFIISKVEKVKDLALDDRGFDVKNPISPK